MHDELKTSISPFGGIGTSFSKDKDYFVSTVESPRKSGRFETLIKPLGGNAVPICIIVSFNSKEAVSNHIAMARMGITTNRGDWNDVAVKDFVPIQFIDMLNSSGTTYHADTFNCDYCESLLSMSGLNYKKKSGGFFKKLFG